MSLTRPYLTVAPGLASVAGYLLLFLLSFAALSSFHVVREGLKSKQVSSFRLLVQVSDAAGIQLFLKCSSLHPRRYWSLYCDHGLDFDDDML